MSALPKYDDLPRNDRGAPSAWELFGDDDSLGMVGRLTPQHAIDAARLVTRGAIFPLDASLTFFDPPLFGRPRLRRETQVRDRFAMNEVLHDFNPQASSQWDALCHVGFDSDVFFNGATTVDVLEGGRNTIDHWARRGIVTRAVLLDISRTAQVTGRTYDPGSSHAFSVDDLEAARASAGVEIRPGDVLILRTGFVEWYANQSQEERQRISARDQLAACGIAHTEAMARYLWDLHVTAAAADCPSLEVWPMDYDESVWPFGCLHRLLLGQFGIGIGELWWLEDLAADCAADGRYEFMLTSAPLNSAGSFGSPANALAIK